MKKKKVDKNTVNSIRLIKKKRLNFQQNASENEKKTYPKQQHLKK